MPHGDDDTFVVSGAVFAPSPGFEFDVPHVHVNRNGTDGDEYRGRVVVAVPAIGPVIGLVGKEVRTRCNFLPECR